MSEHAKSGSVGGQTDGFVSLFRSVAPYVNLFRGKTFVIAFGGKAITGPLA